MLVSTLILSVPIVNADPVWITTLPPDPTDYYPWINYKQIGTGLRVIMDPLFDSTSIGDVLPFPDTSAADLVKGWVTFICQDADPTPKLADLKGFDYSIMVKDIPTGTYTVKAYPTLTFVPELGGLVPSDDLGIVTSYTLGTIRIVGNRAQGTLTGFVDVDAGFYAWRITLELDGTPIVETHFSDPVDFLVSS